MNQKGYKSMIIGVGVIFLLGALNYIGNGYVANTNKERIKSAPSVIPTDSLISPNNWREFKNDNYGVSFSYPSEITVDAGGEGPFLAVKLTLNGPTKSRDLFDDGIKLILMADNTQIKSLKDAAETRLGWSQQNGEIIIPLKEITIGNNKAFTYRSSKKTNTDQFEVSHSFIQLKNNKLLIIENFTVDPTNKGFQKTVDRILSSVVIY